VPARIWVIFLVVVAFFMMQMVNGLKATLKRLELVMPCMLRCGVVFGYRDGLEGAF